ncbi:tyrosine-type recombinase/integrase [Candidatus Woesearchaeota archaeon]|nr:tyrosine-type recombinase/integrase [Candidatus Woesearchaeota archaeon]
METKRLHIYGKWREGIYERELKLLKAWKTSPKNKDLITEFHNYLYSTGTKDLRVTKLSSELRKISLLLAKDFDKATQKDIQSIVAEFNRQTAYSEATKADYRRTIKQFYKFLKKNDARIYSDDKTERMEAIQFYEFLEEDIKISYKRERIDPTTIIIDEDINAIIQKGCSTPKERAIVKLLHETGIRAAELLGMQIKDCIINENCSKIVVDGKTGLRKIPIVDSIPYLAQYLEFHPFKNNENAYVWLTESTNRKLEPMQHRGVQKLIDRCFQRAGVRKRKNMHWFRHSRASLLAPKLTEQLLCRFMGWTLGSRQVRNYVHLCAEQLEDAYLHIKGIKSNDKEEQRLPKKCACGAINDNICRYCQKCGRAMSVDIVLQDQELMKNEMDKSIQLLMEISKNPELLEAFNKFKDKVKGASQ